MSNLKLHQMATKQKKQFKFGFTKSEIQVNKDFKLAKVQYPRVKFEIKKENEYFFISYLAYKPL